MDDRGRLGLMLLGVVLLALAIGYFVYSKRVSVSDQQALSLPSVRTIEPTSAQPSMAPVPSPSQQPSLTPTPSPEALGAATVTTKGGKALPATGAPEVMLAAALGLSAVIAGWSLKKFPD